MDLQEHLLFVNSAFTTYLPNVDNQTIIDSIETIEKTQPSSKLSNYGGYQSPSISHQAVDNQATLDLFTKYIIPAARKVAEQWQLPTETDRFAYWYNINRKYNFNKTHPHPMAFISGVYYIKVPKDSGIIVFERGRDETDRMDFLTRAYMSKGMAVDNSRTNTEHWFHPHEGLLILFPGHLMHCVNQNLTDDEDDRRISLSFNFY